MIYAAYGDAFLLELPPAEGETHRRLVIVDGGPKHRFQSRNNPGPYSDYFISAISQRWTQLQEAGFVDAGLLAPAAILNSHGDLDHYEGLLELMRRYVEYEDQSKAKMNFQGPYIVPVPRNKYDKVDSTAKWTGSKTKISKRLKACRFYQDDKERKFLKDYPGLVVFYPYLQKDLLVYMKKSVAPPPSPVTNNDGAQAYDGTIVLNPDVQAGTGTNPADASDPNNPFATLQLLKKKGIGFTTLNPAQLRKPGTPDLDTSTTNLSSIVMTTDDNTNGYVTTTGDGIGHRIYEECIVPWHKEINARPHMNVFKVPHHGSVKNNQLNKDVVALDKLDHSPLIAQEASLRELLELGYGSVMASQIQNAEHSRSVTFFDSLDDIPPEKRKSTCHLLAELTWKWLKQHSLRDPAANMGEAEENSVMCNYLNYLRRRHAWYIEHFKTTTDLVQNPPVPPATHTDAQWPDPALLWEEMVNTFYNTAFQKRINEDLVGDPGQLKPVDEFFDVDHEKDLIAKPWWMRWNNAQAIVKTKKIAKQRWLDFYEWIASVERVYEFYMTFTADVYVISANGSHGHPSPATILGIAMAAAKQAHKSSIYLTNGAALPGEAIGLLAASLFTDEDEFKKTLGENAVCEIRYMADGTFSMPVICKPDKSTTYLHYTEKWAYNSTINREEIYRALEKDHTLLPTTNTQVAAYQFAFKRNDDWAGYLAGRPMDMPTAQRPERVVHLQETWEPSTGVAYLHVRAQPDVNLPAYFIFHKQKYDGTFDFTFCEADHQGNANLDSAKKWYYAKSIAGEEKLFGLTKAEADNYNLDLPTHNLAQTLQTVIWHALSAIPDDPSAQTVQKANQDAVVPDLSQDQTQHSQFSDDQLNLASIQSLNAEDAGIEATFDERSIQPMASLENEFSLMQVSPSVSFSAASAGAGAISDSTQTAVVSATSNAASAREAPVTMPKSGSISDYLKVVSKGPPPEPKMTVKRVLEILLGTNNAAKLPQERKTEKNMLLYEIDMANSTVQYEQQDLNINVYSALIKTQNTGTAPPSLSVDGEMFKISSGQLSLAWPLGQAMSLEATVECESGGVVLTSTRTLKADELSRSTTLAQLLDAYCEEKKITTDFKTLGLPKLLAFITGRTLPETSNFLYNRVPAALLRFICVDQKIDVNRSTATALSATLGDGLVVGKAELVLDISNTLGKVNNVLKLAETDIAFNDMGLTLENLGRPNERMTLHGGVKIESILLSFKVEMAESRPTSPLGSALWTFTATSTEKLTDLSTIFGKSQNDLTPDRAVPFSSMKVSAMENKGVGFTLSQPLAGVSKYKLYSVYLATEFDSWKKCLPDGFPLSDVGLEARLEVRHPLDSKFRAYGAIVTFNAPITTSKGNSSLRVSLGAEPLTNPSDYAYRLIIGAADLGVSIMDVAKAIKLDDEMQTMTESMPLVKDIFEKVRLKALGIALINQNDTWKMDDFQLELTVDRFDLGKNLSVVRTELSLGYAGGIWDSKVLGELLIMSKAVRVEFVLPTVDTVGKVPLAVETLLFQSLS